MHLRWCTVGNALQVMHCRWCTTDAPLFLMAPNRPCVPDDDVLVALLVAHWWGVRHAKGSLVYLYKGIQYSMINKKKRAPWITPRQVSPNVSVIVLHYAAHNVRRRHSLHKTISKSDTWLDYILIWKRTSVLCVATNMPRFFTKSYTSTCKKNIIYCKLCQYCNSRLHWSQEYRRIFYKILLSFS